MSLLDPPSLSRTQIQELARLPTSLVAGNRMQFPRRLSAVAAGFNMMTVRWHKSPSVAIDGLRAVWFNGYQEQTNGFLGTGNSLTVAAALMYPVANSPGAAKAFKSNGVASFTVADGQWVVSDLLSVYLPANTPYRLRSYIAPAAGLVPYGIPGLAQSNGALANFTAGAADQGVYASGQTDSTQASTALASVGTSDTLFEPIIIGRPASQVTAFALFGDSLTYGSLEVGVGGGVTAANAGDGWGNVGIWARACALRGYEYLNLGISGSQASTWATDGFSSYPFFIAGQCCNAAVIALGTNDMLGVASTALDNIQRMVNKARTFTNRVVVATLPPRTTGIFTSAAGQTIDATRAANINTVNAAIRAGQITGATVVDINAMVRDPVVTDKWRSDGGAWTDDGTHYNVYAAPLIAAQMIF